MFVILFKLVKYNNMTLQSEAESRLRKNKIQDIQTEFELAKRAMITY